ncbi:MAG: hypothetical protein M0Q44_16750 [Methylobacter sp.]|jgi:hypothetical protein|nr:hypothetical protein [Methylobacter sp.]
MPDYLDKTCEPGIKQPVADMVINSSGIQGTAPLLKIDKSACFKRK